MKKLWVTHLMILAFTARGVPDSKFLAFAQDPAEWGTAVDGVQVGLALATTWLPNYSPPPGNLARLEVRLRNAGNKTVTYNFAALGFGSSLEIDGISYAQPGYAGNDPRRRELAPGAPVVTIALAYQTDLLELDRNGRPIPGNKLSLKPGRHIVRLKTRTRGVHNSMDQVLTLVSNALTIEVPAAAPATKRQ